MANKTVLLLSPHTDDCEIAAGGSMNRWIREGNDLVYVAFSATAKREQLSEELKQALSVFGITSIIILNYITREFSSSRQEILDDMIKLNKIYNPDIVICPSSYDTHQDHAVIREEAFRAFKKITMYGYECPQNNRDFRTDIFIELTDEDMEKKKKAIACYTSQKNRAYTSDLVIDGMARFRGAQIEKRYAEVFEAIRVIL